jgi:hypothetical protein
MILTWVMGDWAGKHIPVLVSESETSWPVTATLFSGEMILKCR